MSRAIVNCTQSVHANTGHSLDTALDYLSKGFSVFALPHGKKAANRSWSKFQTERPTEGEVRKMFSKEKNIAIVAGEASKLVVRDFDERSEYNEWRAKHPTLAAIAPTVATASGYHVYVTMNPIPRLRVSGVGSGELRGAGAYVVAPPSLHPSGVQYSWTVPLTNCLPVVTLEDLDLNLLPLDYTEEDRRGRKSTEDDRREQKPYRDERKTTSVENTTDVDSYLEVIEKSLPTKEGQREKKLFELARRLKPFGEISMDVRVNILNAWWQKAKDIVATKDYAESLNSFLRCVEKAKVPLDDDAVLKLCVERAISKPAPTWSTQLTHLSPECQLLAGLCRELQAYHIENGEDVFFIAVRKAGEYCGVSHKTAATWLQLFERLKKIEIAVKHTSVRATRYRYIAAD